jgi:hypothetical protein
MIARMTGPQRSTPADEVTASPFRRGTRGRRVARFLDDDSASELVKSRSRRPGSRAAPAVDAAYVTGALTSFTAELLISTDCPATVADRHGATTAQIASRVGIGRGANDRFLPGFSTGLY